MIKYLPSYSLYPLYIAGHDKTEINEETPAITLNKAHKKTLDTFKEEALATKTMETYQNPDSKFDPILHETFLREQARELYLQ